MPLKSFEKHALSEKWLEVIKDFDCNGSANSNFEKLNTFLKNDALRYNKDNFSRTTIYIKTGECVAYYSLAMNAIKEPKINVEDKYQSLKSYPALFLTRFAIDKKYKRTGIGKAILNEIIRNAYKNKEIASRFLFLDAYPETISWYLGNPLFKILYSNLTERIENCCEKRILKDLNRRLKQGYEIDCDLDENINIDVLKKNCEKILVSHVNNIFDEIKHENTLLEICHSKTNLHFENNRPIIKLINFNTRQNSDSIRNWLKEKDNFLNMDITIPLYVDINKYYSAIYG